MTELLIIHCFCPLVQQLEDVIKTRRFSVHILQIKRIFVYKDYVLPSE